MFPLYPFTGTGQETDKIHQQKPLTSLPQSPKRHGRGNGVHTPLGYMTVSASSIILGPSLQEKVDAADRNHTDVTEPLADASALVF